MNPLRLFLVRIALPNLGEKGRAEHRTKTPSALMLGACPCKTWACCRCVARFVSSQFCVSALANIIGSLMPVCQESSYFLLGGLNATFRASFAGASFFWGDVCSQKVIPPETPFCFLPGEQPLAGGVQVLSRSFPAGRTVQSLKKSLTALSVRPQWVRSAECHVGVAQNQTGAVTQSLVHASTYQSSILVPVF